MLINMGISAKVYSEKINISNLLFQNTHYQKKIIKKCNTDKFLITKDLFEKTCSISKMAGGIGINVSEIRKIYR